MRIKDEAKQQAVFEATIKLVNEIGFVSSSVAKIAREAKVSPATIYIYYKNKDDLLVSTYVNIKKALSDAMLKDFDETRPIWETVRRIWLNTFDYIKAHPSYFQFTEQFANSPYSCMAAKDKVNKYFEPLTRLIQRGIREKILKDVEWNLMFTFMIHPLIVLANNSFKDNIKLEPKDIERAFNMTWDAIKL
jgi:AcrR family transcriptional regulator